MASELNVLARDAARVARQNPRTADFTRNVLQRALKRDHRLLSRSTAPMSTRRAQPPRSDRRDLDWAMAQARRNRDRTSIPAFSISCTAADRRPGGQAASGFSRHAVLRFAMKLQQYSGPVMAKGLEDTAFYRYNRFIALNEVGGNPDRFGIQLSAFHRANAQRCEALAARHADHRHA